MGFKEEVSESHSRTVSQGSAERRALVRVPGAAKEAFGRFTEWAQALAAAGRTWHVAASGRVHDRKYHAGAGELVERHVTSVRTAEPPFVKTNAGGGGVAAALHRERRRAGLARPDG